MNFLLSFFCSLFSHSIDSFYLSRPPSLSLSRSLASFRQSFIGPLRRSDNTVESISHIIMSLVPTSLTLWYDIVWLLLMWNHQRWLRMTLVMKPLSTYTLAAIHFRTGWFQLHKSLLCGALLFDSPSYANTFTGRHHYRHCALNGTTFDNGIDLDIAHNWHSLPLSLVTTLLPPLSFISLCCRFVCQLLNQTNW